jgi:hypothetical protein
MKKFRIQISAYQYYTDFIIESQDSAEDIENAIIDRLGKSDITWDYLGEMHDPRVNRITYEEVINGGDNASYLIKSYIVGKNPSTLQALLRFIKI